MLVKIRGRNSDGKCLTAAGVRAHLRAASVSVCDPDLVHVFGCETKGLKGIRCSGWQDRCASCKKECSWRRNTLKHFTAGATQCYEL